MRSLAVELAEQRARAGIASEAVPVGHAHREDLETLIDVLRAAVELESRCDFADPPNGPRQNRRAFSAHFPELAALLERWDGAVEQVRIAPGGLWEWFALAAADRGISEPPFALGALIDRLAVSTVERSRHGELEHPHQLDLQHFQDRFGDDQFLSVYVEGQKIARLPVEPASDLELRTDVVEHLVRGLFADAQRSAEARAVGEARDALLDLKQQVLERLGAQASEGEVAFARECPACVRELERELRA